MRFLYMYKTVFDKKIITYSDIRRRDDHVDVLTIHSELMAMRITDFRKFKQVRCITGADR